MTTSLGHDYEPACLFGTDGIVTQRRTIFHREQHVTVLGPIVSAGETVGLFGDEHRARIADHPMADFAQQVWSWDDLRGTPEPHRTFGWLAGPCWVGADPEQMWSARDPYWPGGPPRYV